MKKGWPTPLERGYINIYSKLTSQELRQIFYSREYKKINPSWDDTMVILAQEFALAAKIIGEKVKVFDAGCGNGNYAIEENSSLIDSAFGMDVKPELTEKNKILDEIKYGNLETVPFPAKTFDIATSLWVLEHLANPQKVFQEIYRILNHGGFFIFVTPNKDSLLLRTKRLLGNQWFINVVNRIFYGRKEKDIFKTFYRANNVDLLDKSLSAAGFEEVKLTLNYSPIYTSFNNVTFRLSNLLRDKHHIIGIARKR